MKSLRFMARIVYAFPGRLYCRVMRVRITVVIASVCLLRAVDQRRRYLPRQPGVDAIHYVFRLTVDDGSNRIAGETTVTFRLAEGVSEMCST